MSKGICYLVGAGPGDPGLLTLKARDCIAGADVVVYDYLSNPEFLAYAKPQAEKIYAGKKAGAHTLRQEEINALIVEKTQAGQVVTRLKGGDPFVFGRGGEEAEALAEAGVAFEVVPGISSAIAGPAYAGIPVTHRACNTVLTIFTGHEDPEKTLSSLNFQHLAQAPGTKVMLMGVERMEAIAGQLMAAGMTGDTPVALIRWATTGRQETLESSLGEVAKKIQETGFAAPAVAVFGEVVRRRGAINWFEKRPLFGQRVAVTRTRNQAGALIKQLRDLGADAYELPTIRIEPPKDKKAFYQLVADVHTYDWLVFTSPNGVNSFFEAFYEIYRDAREIGGVRIAAIGPATAERVRYYRFAVDLQPEKYVAESIVEALQAETSLDNVKVLLARAEKARDVLPAELEKLGAIVDEAVAYRTMPETEDVAGGIRRFREEGADWITFTSSSTAENFMALDLPLPPELRTISIGPVTSKTMRELGLKVDAEAAVYDIPGVVAALLQAVEKAKPKSK